MIVSFQCFDTVGWATGRASGLYKTGCWFVGGDDMIGLYSSSSPVVTITSIILCFKKTPANPGSPGKWPLKRRERERERERNWLEYLDCVPMIALFQEKPGQPVVPEMIRYPNTHYYHCRPQYLWSVSSIYYGPKCLPFFIQIHNFCLKYLLPSFSTSALRLTRDGKEPKILVSC